LLAEDVLHLVLGQHALLHKQFADGNAFSRSWHGGLQ
jgi:hypothetical protein